MELSPQELSKFKPTLEFTLKWETGGDKNGGYTNDPDDPGGETKWGISKEFHPDEDIANLTKERALEIYYDEYWNVCGANILDFPDCTAVFDSAVHCGADRARAWIDWTGPFDAQKYLDQRVQYYIERVKKKPAKKKFLAGWMARVTDLRKFLQINTQN